MCYPDCPAFAKASASDRCESIDAFIPVSSNEPLNASRTDRFESQLSSAVYEGELQDELRKIRFNTPVTILASKGDGTGTSVDSDGDSGLSAGGTVGLVLAGAIVVVLCAGFLYMNRGGNQDDNVVKNKNEYREYQGEESEAGLPKDGVLSADDDEMEKGTLVTDQAIQLAPSGATSLGAAYGTIPDEEEEDISSSAHNLSKLVPGAAAAIDAGMDQMAEPGLDESSSEAGQSGWSSRSGVSSMNTGDSSSLDAALAAGATLASLGVSGAARTSRVMAPVDENSTDMPSASRAQLDSLIEAGDWAAVGATAALLAAASDSQSNSSKSRATTRSGGTEANRAAELDHLVEAGDWEGVVLKAAEYQTTGGASSGDKSSIDASAGINSSVDSTSDASATGTGTAGSPSVSTSLSDTPSKAARRHEIRAEVEALVRRVVPEEIDNVDEMMNQFKGREDELVETLRTMQERAVAQKARAAGHKAAKAKAKKSVQRGVVPGADRAKALAAGQTASKSEDQTALDLAIVSGDWKAVGQAAQMIGGTQEKETPAKGASPAMVDDDDDDEDEEVNAAHVNVGGWTGVISASPADELNRSTDTQPDNEGSDLVVSISREEEEALKQAEAWMKIAEQTKTQGGTNAAGASEAAEWAIQRSLTQLRNADQQQKQQESVEEDEV